MATTRIMSAQVSCDDGRLAASVDLVDIGGGEQVVMVDGTPEVRVHPAATVYHLRLISPDRMLPDQLHEMDTYLDAVTLGEQYAGKLTAHADELARLAEDLAL